METTMGGDTRRLVLGTRGRRGPRGADASDTGRGKRRRGVLAKKGRT